MKSHRRKRSGFDVVDNSKNTYFSENAVELETTSVVALPRRSLRMPEDDFLGKTLAGVLRNEQFFHDGQLLVKNAKEKPARWLLFFKGAMDAPVCMPNE